MRPCRGVKRHDLEGGEGLAGVAPSVCVCLSHCRESARSRCLHFDDGDASLDGALLLRVRGVGVDKREPGRETLCVCASGRTDRAPSVFFSQS